MRGQGAMRLPAKLKKHSFREEPSVSMRGFICAARNRATLLTVSTAIRLSVLLLALFLAAGLLAQDSGSSSAHKKTTHKTAATKKTASSGSRHRKKVTAARAHKLKSAFVASNDLRPMARQLVEFRTPAAYSGVETTPIHMPARSREPWHGWRRLRTLH